MQVVIPRYGLYEVRVGKRCGRFNRYQIQVSFFPLLLELSSSIIVAFVIIYSVINVVVFLLLR